MAVTMRRRRAIVCARSPAWTALHHRNGLRRGIEDDELGLVAAFEAAEHVGRRVFPAREQSLRSTCVESGAFMMRRASARRRDHDKARDIGGRYASTRSPAPCRCAEWPATYDGFVQSRRRCLTASSSSSGVARFEHEAGSRTSRHRSYGIDEPAGAAHDRYRSVCLAVHLIETAGLEPRRHQEDVGAGFDQVRERFVVAADWNAT